MSSFIFLSIQKTDNLTLISCYDKINQIKDNILFYTYMLAELESKSFWSGTLTAFGQLRKISGHNYWDKSWQVLGKHKLCHFAPKKAWLHIWMGTKSN